MKKSTSQGFDLNTPQFGTSDVISATGLTNATIQAWLSRDHRFDYVEYRKPGTGTRRLYNARAIIHLALAAELTRFGIGPEAASTATLSVVLDMSDAPEFAKPAFDNPWLPNPTGGEMVTFFGLEAEPGEGYSRRRSTGKEVIDAERDFAHYRAKAAIVLCCGAIAKDVLDKLRAILDERTVADAQA